MTGYTRIAGIVLSIAVFPVSSAAAAVPSDCAALGTLQLPDVHVREAVAVAAADLPRGITQPHCRVSGVVGREIHFTIWLPDTWNRRFVMGGGGGFVGSVQNQALASLNQGYATAGTDTGHQGMGFLASWALDDLERQLNYGHLAVHRVAEVAKAIVRQHYGAAPEYSYFSGCSNGGRQALMEAQRYPHDFDGIVSGAPAYNFTSIAAAFVRNTQAAFPGGGAGPTPLVTPTTLSLLERRILAACDRLDGVADDVMTDPTACKFDLASIPACASGAADNCLTRAQRAAIERIYQPTRSGQAMVYPGQPFGGEARNGGWAAWITGGGEMPVPSLQYSFGTEFFKYLVFGDSTWDYRGYDLANAPRDTRRTGTFLNADDPDLSGFEKRGGKLLLWHGWSDPALNALATIAYHDQVQANDPTFRDYMRLFMLPGVLHCAGGPGADSVDWISAIADWVERDQAPTRLIASKAATDSTPARTRPLCVHPERATYRGTGDPNVEASYACSAP